MRFCHGHQRVSAHAPAEPPNFLADEFFRLDEEAASLEDELAFDPDGNIRDYDAVAEALPVFCISARAYQKLRGRLPGEAVHVEGFRSIEETEIPRLQIHLKVATEEGRANEARRSLTKLNELLTSMKLWVAGDSNVGLRKEDRAKNENFVRAQLGALEVVSGHLHGSLTSDTDLRPVSQRRGRRLHRFYKGSPSRQAPWRHWQTNSHRSCAGGRDCKEMGSPKSRRRPRLWHCEYLPLHWLLPSLFFRRSCA